MSDFNDFLKLMSEAKAKDPKHQKIKEIKETVKEDVNDFFKQLSVVSPKQLVIEEEKIDELVEKVEAIEKIEQEIITEEIPEIKPESDRTSEILKLLAKKDDPDTHTFQQPQPDTVAQDLKAVTNKLKYLEQWVGKIAATGPGSGEVNFRYLDDVNRATMESGNDNWVLEYDAASKKVQFTKDIGPIDSIQFDTTHVDDDHPLGTLTWNAYDRTLNLHHQNGVRQQIGQEQYFPPVKNLTGSTITNGTVCMFAGAESDNNSRLLIAPMIADGTYPSLYIMGVATEDIADGEEGFVTSFGYVNDLDTTAWNKGDILYADPAVPGRLTNVKPTSPNNCIVVAAVVQKSDTAGRIMVRPTIEQKMMYGRFASNVTQIPAANNTPYALDFNISEVERGFHRNGNGLPTSAITAEESGYYSASAIISLTSTNSSAKAFYVWLRKNGVDVPLSARRQSVTGNGIYQSMVYRTTLSMDKDDYFQIMYAASDTAIHIESPDATAFCPAVPAATLLVTQVAL